MAALWCCFAERRLCDAGRARCMLLCTCERLHTCCMLHTDHAAAGRLGRTCVPALMPQSRAKACVHACA
eukprot:9746137-Alexandrium_andersonii.AAC.1